jgi:hypothetical protein
MTPSPGKAAIWLVAAAAGIAVWCWDVAVYHPHLVWLLLGVPLALVAAVVGTIAWTVPDSGLGAGAAMGAAFPFVWGILAVLLQWVAGICSYAIEIPVWKGAYAGGCVENDRIVLLWSMLAFVAAIPFAGLGALAGWLTDLVVLRSSSGLPVADGE